MKSNGYFRSKERTRRLKRLAEHGCYFVQHKEWGNSDSRLIRIYMSGKRKFAKSRTNGTVRHADSVPNYSGYRKASEYLYVLF